MAERGGSAGLAELSDEDLRSLLATSLRAMMARRPAVQDRHAMLRDLRLEMQMTLERAPTRHGNVAESVLFRARLAQALQHVIAAAETHITTDYSHLPGIRN